MNIVTGRQDLQSNMNSRPQCQSFVSHINKIVMLSKVRNGDGVLKKSVLGPAGLILEVFATGLQHLKGLTYLLH
jgi:hypothetical protein